MDYVICENTLQRPRQRALGNDVIFQKVGINYSLSSKNGMH